MTRRVLALLVLVLCACTAVRSRAPATVPDQALVTHGAPDRAEFLPSEVGAKNARLQHKGLLTDHGAIICVEVHFEDGSSQDIPTGCATVPPTPTPTASPAQRETVTPVIGFSPTPTAPPTNTPRPTSTVTPTPTPTSPVELESTPTPESTTIPTPQSTIVPKDTCFAGVISGGLNVRSNPSVDGVRLGVLAQAARVPVVMIHVVKSEGDPAREEWGMIVFQGKTAWIALWRGGVELARLDDNERCWPPLMPVEYETAMASMCLGWHSIPVNVDKNDMQASFVEWREKGECVAAKGVEEIHAPALALAFGGIGAVRFPRGPTQSGDCADTSLPPNNAALDMARRILPIALTQAPPEAGFTIEISNECQGIYFNDLAWLDTYLAAEIRAFSAYYPRRVIFGTMLAGAWTQERVNALRTTWDTALEYGACLGIHAGSPLAGYDAVDGLSIEWLWRFSFQHRDIRRWLVQLDPRYVAIPFCVTEFAVGGGWSEYRAEDYHSYAEEIKHDGVLFMAGFTAGTWNQFSVNGHMLETARLWQ